MILVVIVLTILCFGFVLLYGAPYLPTHTKQAEKGLDMLNLHSGQTLYELGCGDGKVLRLAARRGLNAVGYELNPLLFLVAKLTTWKYRYQVQVRFGNFWKADISRADVVFVFLLDRFMVRLDEKMKTEGRGKLLLSYTFEVPGRKPANIQDGMYLYKY